MGFSNELTHARVPEQCFRISLFNRQFEKNIRLREKSCSAMFYCYVPNDVNIRSTTTQVRVPYQGPGLYLHIINLCPHVLLRYLGIFINEEQLPPPLSRHIKGFRASHGELQGDIRKGLFEQMFELLQYD